MARHNQIDAFFLHSRRFLYAVRVYGFVALAADFKPLNAHAPTHPFFDQPVVQAVFFHNGDHLPL